MLEKETMVCRACKIQTFVTSDQAIVYAVSTLLIALSIFFGVLLNRLLEKKQRRYVEAIKTDDLWDEIKNDQELGYYVKKSRPKKKKKNSFVELQDQKDEVDDEEEDVELQSKQDLLYPSPEDSPTTITLNGTDFQKCVSKLARNAGTVP